MAHKKPVPLAAALSLRNYTSKSVSLSTCFGAGKQLYVSCMLANPESEDTMGHTLETQGGEPNRKYIHGSC